MPDPTSKRAALIEALGHAICIADLRERIAATVDAIVAIVDERVAELRAIEAEGGETTAIRHCLGPGCKGDGCCFCACDACEPEDEPRNDDACRVKMDQARAGTKCASGTVGCIAHSPPDEDALSEEGDCAGRLIAAAVAAKDRELADVREAWRQDRERLRRARIALDGIATLHGFTMTTDGRVEADERMREIARRGLDESMGGR